MIEYLAQHPHLVVLIVTILIWLGIAFFLWQLNKRIDHLENAITQRKLSNSSSTPTQTSL